MLGHCYCNDFSYEINRKILSDLSVDEGKATQIEEHITNHMKLFGEPDCQHFFAQNHFHVLWIRVRSPCDKELQRKVGQTLFEKILLTLGSPRSSQKPEFHPTIPNRNFIKDTLVRMSHEVVVVVTAPSRLRAAILHQANVDLLYTDCLQIRHNSTQPPGTTIGPSPSR